MSQVSCLSEDYHIVNKMRYAWISLLHLQCNARFFDKELSCDGIVSLDTRRGRTPR